MHPHRFTSKTRFHASRPLYELPTGPIPALLRRTATCVTYGMREVQRRRGGQMRRNHRIIYWAVQPTSPQVSRTLSLSAWTCSRTPTSVGTTMTLFSPTIAFTSRATSSRPWTDTSARATLSPILQRVSGNVKRRAACSPLCEFQRCGSPYPARCTSDDSDAAGRNGACNFRINWISERRRLTRGRHEENK
jgi:hypothetical protein